MHKSFWRERGAEASSRRRETEKESWKGTEKKQREEKMRCKKEEKAQKAVTKVAKQEANKQQQQCQQPKSNKRRTEFDISVLSVLLFFFEVQEK